MTADSWLLLLSRSPLPATFPVKPHPSRTLAYPRGRPPSTPPSASLFLGQPSPREPVPSPFLPHCGGAVRSRPSTQPCTCDHVGSIHGWPLLTSPKRHIPRCCFPPRTAPVMAPSALSRAPGSRPAPDSHTRGTFQARAHFSHPCVHFHRPPTSSRVCACTASSCNAHALAFITSQALKASATCRCLTPRNLGCSSEPARVAIVLVDPARPRPWKPME